MIQEPSIEAGPNPLVRAPSGLDVRPEAQDPDAGAQFRREEPISEWAWFEDDDWPPHFGSARLGIP